MKMTTSMDLNEEQISYKRHMLDNLKIQVDALDIDIKNFQAMLDLKLPERQVRNEMFKKQDQKANAERNVKVLEKQIRERKEVTFEDETANATSQ